MSTTQTQPVSINPVQTQESRPVPDPTSLTTQQTDKAVAALRDLLEIRLDGMDKAILLLQKFADNRPTTEAVSLQVDALQKLHDEKFKSVETQFKERDTRTEQSSKDSKVAVDAALQAAKEAVSEQNRSNTQAMAKSEAAFTKQMDQMVALVAQQGKTIDDKVDDLKQRLTMTESHKQGGNDMVAYIIAGVSAIVAVGSLIALLLMNKV